MVSSQGGVKGSGQGVCPGQCRCPGWGKSAGAAGPRRPGPDVRGLGWRRPQGSTLGLGDTSPAFSVHPDLPQRETQHPLPRVR